MDIFGPNIKAINLIVHDNGSGFGLWNGSDDSELYGNLIYYNGSEGGDRGHGHSIYSQNRLGLKRITDNIYFKSFSHGIHIYGSENAYLDNYLIEGNTGFDNGVLSPSAGAKTQFLIGGGRVANNITLRDNASFFSGNTGRNELGYGAGCNGLVAERNMFVAPVAMKMSCTSVTMNGNLFYGTLDGLSAGQYPNNTFTTVMPAGVRVFARANRFEPGRGNVVVYNWDGLSTVPVNLSTILAPGTAFEIRDAQNYFGGPVAAGVYQGGTVNVPMTGTAVSPLVGVAEVALVHTPVRFGSFIVLPATGAVGVPPPNQAPVVNAGASQTITLPSFATLNGTASDDGKPNGVLTYAWSMVGGPAAVSFGNAAALTTNATFTVPGVYELQLAASDGQLTATARTQVTVLAAAPPPTGSAVIRVNAGGPRTVDSFGQVWAADAGFAGGATYSNTRTIAGVTGASRYQSVRYGNFGYKFAVPNGSYRVSLQFAEIYHTVAGARVFSVSINGSPVLGSFDIVRAGGVATPVVRQFDVAVLNGEIAIQFSSLVDYAQVNAIEIQSLSAAAVTLSVSPGTATVSAGATQQFAAAVLNAVNAGVTWSLAPAVGTINAAGLYQAPPAVAAPAILTVTATSVADPTKSASAQLMLQPAAVPPPTTFTPIRMNAGGPQYLDRLNQIWAMESNVAGGATYSTGASIANTVDPTLYRSVRYGTFTYRMAVSSGARVVRLRFSEIYYTLPGKRVFHVRINGQQVLTNFDIVAHGGAFTAVDREFNVNVTNGQLVIEYVPVIENPCVSAIEIR